MPRPPAPRQRREHSFPASAHALLSLAPNQRKAHVGQGLVWIGWASQGRCGEGTLAKMAPPLSPPRLATVLQWGRPCTEQLGWGFGLYLTFSSNEPLWFFQQGNDSAFKGQPPPPEVLLPTAYPCHGGNPLLATHCGEQGSASRNPTAS